MADTIELQRYIDLTKYDVVSNPEGNAKAQEWLRANGIQPEDVLAHQHVNVAHNALEVAVFVRNEDGTKKLGNAGYEKAFKTVDLQIRPEVFGI